MLIRIVMNLLRKLFPFLFPPPSPDLPIKVNGVAFLNANNQIVRKLADPNAIIQLRDTQHVAAIRVSFTGDVDHG